MDLPTDPKTCWLCEAPVTAAARFCSACGQQLDQTVPTRKPSTARWYHNIWFVLFLLFFVLGPFGLPMVWSNPRMSRGMKLGLTGVMVLYMGILIQLVMRMVYAIADYTTRFNQTMGF